MNDGRSSLDFPTPEEVIARYSTLLSPTPARRAEELARVTTERDELRAHVENLRDLAERSMSKAEAQEQLVLALEAEAQELIRQLSAREDRITLLEAFLRMMAEVDDTV